MKSARLTIRIILLFFLSGTFFIAPGCQSSAPVRSTDPGSVDPYGTRISHRNVPAWKVLLSRLRVGG
jgi:hypothetical protein